MDDKFRIHYKIYHSGCLDEKYYIDKVVYNWVSKDFN